MGEVPLYSKRCFGLLVARRRRRKASERLLLLQGTSLMRKRYLVGPYGNVMHRALGWSWGGCVPFERGTPVPTRPPCLHPTDAVFELERQNRSFRIPVAAARILLCRCGERDVFHFMVRNAFVKGNRLQALVQIVYQTCGQNRNLDYSCTLRVFQRLAHKSGAKFVPGRVSLFPAR